MIKGLNLLYFYFKAISCTQIKRLHQFLSSNTTCPYLHTVSLSLKNCTKLAQQTQNSFCCMSFEPWCLECSLNIFKMVISWTYSLQAILHRNTHNIWMLFFKHDTPSNKNFFPRRGSIKAQLESRDFCKWLHIQLVWLWYFWWDALVHTQGIAELFMDFTPVFSSRPTIPN